MDLRTLRAFVEVVRQGGFTQAGRTLFATQSTVSKAVKQLEEELGLPLLDRVGHDSHLTAAGEIVYRRAVTMLAERQDLVRELNEFRGLEKGLLRLGLPAVGSNTLFAPLFAVFRIRHPAIEIRLVEQGSQRLEELLLARELDMAATLLPASDQFDSLEIRCEPLDLLVAANHPLAARPSVALAELADQPFILFGEGFALNPIILDACRGQGFTPAVTARSSQIEFIIQLVAGGLGIGFLPRMIAANRQAEGIRNIPLRAPAIDWRIALVWRKNSHLSPAAQAWLDLARENIPLG